MNRNTVVLNYHESLLRISDIELLQGPYWLNDTLISFYFEYLENNKFMRSPTLLFVSPQVTQCIKVIQSSEMGVFLNPLIDKKEFIFFALNDNEQTECSGGTHWSLLVFSAPEKMIYHFDSLRGANQDQAMEFSEKLFKFFGYNAFGCFREPICLQQSNGYDCGIHVLCNAENVANYILKHVTIEGCPSLDKQKVLMKRKEMFDLIYSLRNNQNSFNLK